MIDEKYRVLVVDDEESIRDVLEEFLEMHSYIVRTVPNGIDALAVLSKEFFDVILLDIKMPGMDGIEVLRKIRESGLTSVVVMMTAFGTVETATEAFKLKAFDYILKPFNSDMIFNTIGNAISHKKLIEENINLKATVNLFNVAQAVEDITQKDQFIKQLASALLHESSADAISVYLCSDEKYEFSHHESFFVGDSFDLGDIDAKAISSTLKEQGDLISFKGVCNSFFEKDPEDKVASFMAIALKRSSSLKGFILFYSFNKRVYFTNGQKKFMKVFATYLAATLENADLYNDIKETFSQTIQSFAHAIEAKDEYTHGHSERVTEYAVAIAQQMNLSDSELDLIYNAGRLHDIGKIGMQYEKLNKPGKLTEQEWQMFRKHPTIGKTILEPIKFLKDVVPIVFHHHERFDGNGYPEGLKGKDIPLGSRILAIADTYDAMTSDRSYRNALSHEIAESEIVKHAGSQFDSELVPYFISAIKKLGKI